MPFTRKANSGGGGGKKSGKSTGKAKFKRPGQGPVTGGLRKKAAKSKRDF